jgi:hypothetical protein
MKNKVLFLVAVLIISQLGFSQTVYHDRLFFGTGEFEPDSTWDAILRFVRIEGNATRLELGNATTHNLWYNKNTKLLAVGHHTSELLFFDMAYFNYPNLQGYPQNYNIAPTKVCKLNEKADNSDHQNWSLYGFHWNTEDDIMYCSLGYLLDLDSVPPGSPNQKLLVLYGVSNLADSGLIVPDRVIYWDNGDKYWPPQPIWVHKVEETVNSIEQSQLSIQDFQVLPNPAIDHISVHFSSIPSQNITLRLINELGQQLFKENINSFKGEFEKNISLKKASKGVYIIQIITPEKTFEKKIVKIF